MLSYPYTVRWHGRAKRIRIRIDRTGTIVVTAPPSISQTVVDRFVHDNQSWIHNGLERQRAIKTLMPGAPRDTYHRYRARAQKLITDRVRELNIPYQFSYRRITVKDTKTRWGSCSSQKNIHFHYRLFFLPEALRDYVIVHELCHIQHMNHSRRFWELVAKTIPDYRERRQALRQYSLS